MEVKDETETVADVDQTMMKEDTIEVGFFFGSYTFHDSLLNVTPCIISIDMLVQYKDMVVGFLYKNDCNTDNYLIQFNPIFT